LEYIFLKFYYRVAVSKNVFQDSDPASVFRSLFEDETAHTKAHDQAVIWEIKFSHGILTSLKTGLNITSRFKTSCL
jgi:hypothetical protein